MHRFRSASPFAAGGRVVIVVLALLAWLAISNHCALAALSTAASHTEKHRSCCEDAIPAKKGPHPQPEIVCCKVLKATCASLADVVPALNATGEIDFPASAFSDFSVRPPRALAHPPTGPPRAISFAEFQRSHRGNAPPVDFEI